MIDCSLEADTMAVGWFQQLDVRIKTVSRSRFVFASRGIMRRPMEWEMLGKLAGW